MTASKKVLSADEAAASIEPLLKLASEHFASLALSAAVKLKLPDLIGDGTVTAAELAESLRGRSDADVNEDALERTMRLLCASGVLDQCAEAPGGRGALYRLSPVGALLQTGAEQPSLACAVVHWTGPAVLGAWSKLPELILGGGGLVMGASESGLAGASALELDLPHPNPNPNPDPNPDPDPNPNPKPSPNPYLNPNPDLDPNPNLTRRVRPRARLRRWRCGAAAARPELWRACALRRPHGGACHPGRIRLGGGGPPGVRHRGRHRRGLRRA